MGDEQEDKKIKANEQLLTEATGLNWSHQAPITNFLHTEGITKYTSTPVTDWQLRGIASLDRDPTEQEKKNNINPREILHALAGEGVSGSDVIKIITPYYQASPLEYKPEDLTPAVLKTLKEGKDVIRAALGTQDFEKQVALNHSKKIDEPLFYIAANGDFEALDFHHTALQTIGRLEKLGLSPTKDFEIVPFAGADGVAVDKIIVHPKALPDPKGDPDAYTKLINNPLHAATMQAGQLAKVVHDKGFSQGNGTDVNNQPILASITTERSI